MVKIWLITLLLALPAPAWSSTENNTDKNSSTNTSGQGAVTGYLDDPPITWVDTSHAYATDQVQALTVWMDNFFGDPNYDLEKPESLVRLEWRNIWDEKDDYKTRVRLRGKLQMPRISKRLNLVFNGEDGDKLGADDRKNVDRIGLQYNLGELNRSRVDLTLGVGGGDVRPGIRYRNQGPITEQSGYRYTQRLQWEDSEGFYTTSELNLDRTLDANNLLRWNNRVIYGEESDGVEWRTQLSLGQRRRPEHKSKQLVIGYFGSIKGATDPSYVENYRLGMVFRRQVFRRYLFAELEPSYNFRKDSPQDKRDEAWNIILRFEIVLQRDLMHVGLRSRKKSNEVADADVTRHQTLPRFTNPIDFPPQMPPAGNAQSR